jgi:UDP-N-acetyl-D-glucosamine dehydrogenase
MSKKRIPSLHQKILSRKAKIAVIGLGYVGLPLLCEFGLRRFPVLGIDLDSKKIGSLEKGISYIEDVPSSTIKKLLNRGKLQISDGFEGLEEADAVIICVPTPLNRAKDPDISFVVAAAKEIKKYLHRGMLVVLESTTYPGTTEEVIQPILESAGLKCGKDFHLCFSPERVDPSNKNFKTRDIPKVVGGVTKACTEAAAALYGLIVPKVISVSCSKTAEMTKLLENTFRIVNIGMINELALAADKLGVDIWEAIDAAKTKPFGFMPFYPGPGVGGHCIGIDPLYLSWKARMQGVEIDFINLARRVNASMPEKVASSAVALLSEREGRAIRLAKVLLLGVAYKKYVSDIRESPALDILEILKKMGASTAYHDPYVPEIDHGSLKLKSVPLTPALLRRQHLVILVTDHDCLNKKMILKHSRLILDTRNYFKGARPDKVVRL